MVSKGQLVKCPACRKEFNLPKHAEDGDIVKCTYCDTELEVIKKKRHLDVKPFEELVEKIEIEGGESGGE